MKFLQRQIFINFAGGFQETKVNNDEVRIELIRGLESGLSTADVMRHGISGFKDQVALSFADDRVRMGD